MTTGSNASSVQRADGRGTADLRPISITRGWSRQAEGSALIEFGRESGAAVLAEHIESELQLVELRRLGVHYGQGYHLGRPAPLPVAA